MWWSFRNNRRATGESQTFILLVLGLTGDGKSTFINTALGEQKLNTSGDLLPACTTRVQPVIHGSSQSRQIIFVDTPGLDYKGHRDVVNDINKLLQKHQRKHADALVYLYRATRNVITEPDATALERCFLELCGPNWKQHVVLATTMGGAKTNEELVKLEQTLQTKYIKGVEVMRFVAPKHEDAWEVIGKVVPRTP